MTNLVWHRCLEGLLWWGGIGQVWMKWGELSRWLRTAPHSNHSSRAFIYLTHQALKKGVCSKNIFKAMCYLMSHGFYRSEFLGSYENSQVLNLSVTRIKWESQKWILQGRRNSPPHWTFPELLKFCLLIRHPAGHINGTNENLELHLVPSRCSLGVLSGRPYHATF